MLDTHFEGKRQEARPDRPPIERRDPISESTGGPTHGASERSRRGAHAFGADPLPETRRPLPSRLSRLFTIPNLVATAIGLTVVGATAASAETIGDPLGVAQAGTTPGDNPSGVVAIAYGGCAYGALVAISVDDDFLDPWNGGCGAYGSTYSYYRAIAVGVGAPAASPGVAITTGPESAGGLIGISGWGPASGGWEDPLSPNVAVSGLGPANAALLAVSGGNEAHASPSYGYAVGLGNTTGYAAVSGIGNANATTLGISGIGNANASTLGIAGSGDAWGWAAIANGDANGQGVAVGALNNGNAAADALALSAAGDAYARSGVALGGNNAHGALIGGTAWGQGSGGLVGISGLGNAYGAVAIAGGNAYAYGGLVAVSLTGDARGGSVLNVGGGGCGC